MTEDLRQIETELHDYEAKLYAASTDYSRLVKDAATKRAVYDVAYAQELLKIKSDTNLKATVPEREAIAVIAVQDFMTDCRIAESLADGAKRHLSTLQAILSSIQTRASLFKTERSFSGVYA